jgi:hypothetical protein
MEANIYKFNYDNFAEYYRALDEVHAWRLFIIDHLYDGKDNDLSFIELQNAMLKTEKYPRFRTIRMTKCRFSKNGKLISERNNFPY